MFIDKINLNTLRVFEVVFRLKSMTKAAEELHLTQSGVSQHMQSLESTLQIKLFNREKKNIFPTPYAVTLYEKCKKELGELETVLVSLAQDKEIAGMIRIGMPVEYGTNLLLPVLGRFLKENAKVTVKIHLGLFEEVFHKLKEGELDFAFLGSMPEDKQITVKKVFDEEYGLYISKNILKKKASNTKEFYESIDYVEYLDREIILRGWFQHHLKSSDLKLNVRAYTGSPRAVQSLIINGVGAGILPKHMAEEDHIKKNIVEIKGSGKPMIWHVYVAYLENRTRSLAVSEALKFLA